MLLSVIIPAYNRENYVLKAIYSLLSQPSDGLEVIVVDDGSTDNTERVVHSIKDTRLSYIKIINSERGAARNVGIKAAKGLYVTFLDSDDFVYGNYFSEFMIFTDKMNLPQVFHMNYEIISDDGKKLRRDTNITPINDKLVYGNYLSCAGVFIKRDVALKNLFNENRLLAGMEDWELWLRLASKNKIEYHPVVTSCLVQHGSRSVISDDSERLISKVEGFLKVVLQNDEVMTYYGNKENILKSSSYSYLSLHLALTKRNRVKSIAYLVKSLGFYPATIFSRRFFAILKHLLI